MRKMKKIGENAKTGKVLVPRLSLPPSSAEQSEKKIYSRATRQR